MPVETVNSEQDLEQLRARIGEAARASLSALCELCALDPIEVLARLKFSEIGRHPLEDRSLNLIEQVNQTFTYLASIAAAAEIARRHPGAWPIELRLGTAEGSDVLSQSAGVAAEVFAAVRPGNNDKLRKDIDKVSRTSEQHKYVFFYCPGEANPAPLEGHDVTIVALNEDQVLGPLRESPNRPPQPSAFGSG
jgi:hypothetical protein